MDNGNIKQILSDFFELTESSFWTYLQTLSVQNEDSELKYLSKIILNRDHNSTSIVPLKVTYKNSIRTLINIDGKNMLLSEVSNDVLSLSTNFNDELDVKMKLVD